MRGRTCGLLAASLATILAFAGTYARAARGASALVVAGLRWDGREQPFGFMQLEPRLEWIASTAQRGQRQTAYRVLVASSADKLKPGKADLWDSQKVASAESINVRYGGPTPKARQRAFWTVRVWDTADRPSAFARPATWEMGLYDEEWEGMWIGRPQASGRGIDGAGDRSATYVRKGFPLARGVTRARLYASGFGAYELWLNGKRATEDVLQPGWTDYEKRVLFQTYDVTSLLHRGDNVLGAIVGGGWCTAALGGRAGACGTEPPRVMMQLEVTLDDGTLLTVITDRSWRASPAPIVSAHLLDGETYDARLEQPGWSTPRFDDARWASVQQYDKLKERDLAADSGPAIRLGKDLRPVRVTEPRPATYVFDLGQSIVGWPRIRVKAPAGGEVTLRYAQSLAPDGTVRPADVGAPAGVDRYVARGVGVETWEPRFAVHAFRYVEVTGLPGGRPGPDLLVGRAVHSVMPEAGRLETSSADVNRLFANIVAAQLGAFLSVPSAGNQRVGSMLDARAFATTACLTRDVRGFYRKWIDDVRDAQHANAAYADTAPAVSQVEGGPGAGSAGVLVPWADYLCYVDRTALDAHMASMGRFLDRVRAQNPDLVWAKDLGANHGDPLEQGPGTDKRLVATAELAYAASALAQIARQGGKDLETYTRTYEALASGTREAFARRFAAAADGKLASDTQTAYAMALATDALPAGEARVRAGRHLAAAIDREGGRATTGLLASAHLLPALSKVGRDDLAYRVLLQETCPGLMCDVKKGATTVEPYALGAVGAWMFDAIGGIALDPAAPGGRHVFVRPRPGGEVTSGRASYDSMYGRITTDWRREAHVFRLRVSVPANGTATVTLPAAGRITEGGQPVEKALGVKVLRAGPTETELSIASGSYDFVAVVP